MKAKEGGRHLAHAVISIKGTNLKTQCDGTGHYKIGNLPVGKQTVVATLSGYQPQELEVEMVAGKGTEAYFELEKDPLELSQVVVTGTRTSHFVKDVPIRTEVLTSQAITKRMPRIFTKHLKEYREYVLNSNVSSATSRKYACKG